MKKNDKKHLILVRKNKKIKKPQYVIFEKIAYQFKNLRDILNMIIICLVKYYQDIKKYYIIKNF